MLCKAWVQGFWGVGLQVFRGLGLRTEVTETPIESYGRQETLIIGCGLPNFLTSPGGLLGSCHSGLQGFLVYGNYRRELHKPHMPTYILPRSLHALV